jgi:hypothetical protein
MTERPMLRPMPVMAHAYGDVSSRKSPRFQTPKASDRTTASQNT